MWKTTGLEFVRGYDLTHGTHGFHPHLHLLLLLPPLALASRPREFLDRWVASLEAVGGSAVISAQDIQECRDVDRATHYAISLAGVWETLGTPTKAAKATGSRTAFDLARAAVCGDGEAASLWKEYALATKGKRACTVSRGLKLVEEKEAAQARKQINDEVPETVAIIVPSALRALDPHLCDVLRAVAVSVEAGRAALWRTLGPPGASTWREPKPPPDG